VPAQAAVEQARPVIAQAPFEMTRPGAAQAIIPEQTCQNCPRTLQATRTDMSIVQGQQQATRTDMSRDSTGYQNRHVQGQHRLPE
jgi:hypothetical protein